MVMNGVPNSPLDRYDQVKDVVIQNNTLIDCSPITFGAGKSAELSLPAINSIFTNNLFLNSEGGEIAEYLDSVDGIEFSTNIVDTSTLVDTRFFTKSSVDWSYDTSIPIPTSHDLLMRATSFSIS